MTSYDDWKCDPPDTEFVRCDVCGEWLDPREAVEGDGLMCDRCALDGAEEND